MTETYPHAPGWKDETVSRENAETFAPRLTGMRKVVLDLYRTGFVGSADDAARRLKLSPFSTRPRCTELVKMGLIERVRIERTPLAPSRWLLRAPPRQMELF